MSEPVVIVVPPVLTCVRPVIGPSTLKSELQRRGYGCRVEYANLDFAALVGVDVVEWLSSYTDTRWLLSEWIFASAAFPNCELPDPSQYVQDILGQLAIKGDRLEIIMSLRAKAAEFARVTARKIIQLGPRIVGFSSSFEQNAASIAIAKELKALDPSLVICMGGANCAGELGRGVFDNFDVFDFVFSGEADVSFPDLCEKLLAGNAADNRRRLIDNAPIMDMDALPVPDYADFFRKIGALPFRDKLNLGLVIETSRGCWWGAKHHCTFCGLNSSGMQFRSKSADRARDEIKQLACRWDVRNFSATDNIMDVRHVRDVFGRLTEEGEKYRFFYEVKANLKSHELLILADAGVDTIQPGIESLDNSTLKLMKKGVSAIQNVFLLRRCLELSIRPIWNILAGFPKEEESSYENTLSLIPLLEHLPPPRNVATLRIDRFSPIFANPADHGFSNLRPMMAYSYIYPLGNEQLSRIAYFFEGDSSSDIAKKTRDRLVEVAGVWQSAHISGKERPICVGLNFAGVIMIKDTRRRAVETFTCLSPVASALVEALEEVRNVDKVLADVADEFGESIQRVTEEFARLQDNGFILKDGYSAVRLVCLPVDRRIRENDAVFFPGGDLKAGVFGALDTQN